MIVYHTATVFKMCYIGMTTQDDDWANGKRGQEIWRISWTNYLYKPDIHLAYIWIFTSIDMCWKLVWPWYIWLDLEIVILAWVHKSASRQSNGSGPNTHEALNQCCADAGPPSTTLAQHPHNIGFPSRLCWDVLIIYIKSSGSHLVTTTVDSSKEQ